MYLDKNAKEEIFRQFCTNFGGSKIMTIEGFMRAINSITDESNMLKNPDYISLPDLRNKLGITTHVSSLITMHKDGESSDKEFITDIHEVSEDFKKSIKDLAQSNK